MRLALPCLFLLGMIVNGSLTMVGWHPSSNLDENRTLATRPNWEGSLATFLRDTDRWLTDSFAFRKWLASSYNTVLYYVFRSTLKDRIVIGHGPWIFGADFDDQGRIAPRLLSQDYLKRLKLTLTERRDWLAERGTELILLFMPTKTNVYGDMYLPHSWKFDANQPTESEQLYRFLGVDFAKNVVPVREAIRELSAEIPVYYHTDGHANHQGSFAAFQRLLDHIATHFPEKAPAPYPASERKLDYMQPTAYGRLMGIPFKDASWVSVPVGGFQFTEQSPSRLQDMVPTGAKPRFLTNPRAQNIHAVLIGDSFTNRMTAYFGQVFRKTERIHTSNVANLPEEKFPIKFLDMARPDYVVLSYVESRLVACAEVCDGFPLSNAMDVRQARLRRLFRDASLDQNDDGFVLAQISNLGLTSIQASASRIDPFLTLEIDKIKVEAGETQYIFLGTKAAEDVQFKPVITGGTPANKVVYTTRIIAADDL